MPTQIELLKKYGIAVRGHVGQHLLIDPNTQRKIVDLLDIKKTDSVIEIGPGLGALTSHLMGKCKKLILIEMDAKFVEILRAEYPELTKKSCELLHRDILKVDLDEILEPQTKYKVISNLPYYITAPILFHLLDYRSSFSKMVLMVQKEVGDRMTAPPGGKDYGRLSLGIHYAAEVEHAFDVSPSCFTPRPAVESSVLVMDLHPDAKLLPARVEKKLFQIIKTAFSQRRKILISLLAADRQLGLDRKAWQEVFNKLGISLTARGEELFLKDFISLAKELQSV